jgi:hypothetical protein
VSEIILRRPQFNDHAGTRGPDDPAEIRPEVRKEAPRQTPQVPSRILQEGKKANRAKAAWFHKTEKCITVFAGQGSTPMRRQ